MKHVLNTGVIKKNHSIDVFFFVIRPARHKLLKMTRLTPPSPPPPPEFDPVIMMSMPFNFLICVDTSAHPGSEMVPHNKCRQGVPHNCFFKRLF